MKLIFSRFSHAKILVLLGLLLFMAIGIPLFFQQGQKTIQRVAGKIYYVSKNGNNSDGISWSTAWNELATINWSVIKPGDTIYIDGGATHMVYMTTLNIRKSGTSRAPLTIQLATEPGRNGQAVIFGGRKVPLPYCGQTSYTYQIDGVQSVGVNFHDSSYVVIDGTKWNGITDYGHNYDGITFSSRASHDTVRNMEVYDNGIADTNTVSGTWETDRPGIHPLGADLTFEEVNIHDNGQDAFQSGGLINNIMISRSWLHNTRENPAQPSGTSFNFPCTHQDGIQVYDGGNVSTLFRFESDIFGPGLMQGILLAEPGPGHFFAAHNVTITNSLFINADNASIMGSPPTTSGWVMQNITVFLSPFNPSGGIHFAFYLDGSGFSVSNSIVYGGDVHLPSGTGGSGNCQFKTNGNTNAIMGLTIDPEFVSNVAKYTQGLTLSQLANADFSLQSASSCLGKGASITSVTQLIKTATSSVLFKGDKKREGIDNEAYEEDFFRRKM